MWRGAIGWIVGTSIGSLIAFVLRSIDETKAFADFVVFWTAAKFQIHEVYDAVALTDAQRWFVPNFVYLRPFPYPPSALPWIEPFGWLPFYVSALIWTVLGLFAFICSCRLMAPRLAVALAVFSRPVLEALFAGQVSLFVGALVIASVSQLRPRPILAGMLIGLAATIKPQTLILAPFVLAFGGHWRALFAAISTGAVVGSLCVLVQGPSVWFDWIALVSSFESILKGGKVFAAGVTPAVWELWPATLAAAGLGLTVAWRCARLGPPMVLAGIVVGSLLCSPYALVYDLSIMAPVAALIILDRKQPILVWFISGLGMIGAGGPFGILAFALMLLWITRPNAPGEFGGAKTPDSAAPIADMDSLAAAGHSRQTPSAIAAG